MSTHNICFREEIRKTSTFLFEVVVVESYGSACDH